MPLHQRLPRRFCAHCGGSLEPASDSGLHCPACGVFFYDNPTPAVAAVVVDPAGRLLLVERDKDPKAGWWSLPGGFIEIDESPEEALRRELREETGLEAGQIRLLAVGDETSRRYGRVLVVCYRVLDYSGQPRAGDDARSLDFFPRAGLPEIAFQCHRRFIQIFNEEQES